MNKIINIMPMAGLGKRFIESNYKLPKPRSLPFVPPNPRIDFF